MSINKSQKYISGRNLKGKLEQGWSTTLDLDVSHHEDKMDFTFVIYKLMVNFDVTAIEAKKHRPIIIDDTGDSNDHLFGIDGYLFDYENVQYLENEDQQLILEYMIDSGIRNEAYKERDPQEEINRLRRRMANITTILKREGLSSRKKAYLKQKKEEFEKIKALKWKDIDFEKRQIEVRRSCRRGRVTGTKTDKRRRVDMTPHLTGTLKELRISQKRDSLKNGRPVPEWVFANKKGKIFIRVAFENALNRCLEGANLRRIRIHDLRHTYATIRLMRGHNVGDVSYQLGHSSIKMTYDVYAHWIPGQFKSEVDELDQAHPNAPQAHPANRT